MTAPLNVAEVRDLFPALTRDVNGRRCAYFDGPAGSQVPRSVADAVARYLCHTNANRGAPFATARESDALLDHAHEVLAEFLHAADPGEVVFGANMTSITLAVSRALSRQWSPGDEILVTQLDHDANVTPWVLAARDAGATVRHVPVRSEDCTLELQAYHELLSPRTRLVALGLASNATGTINPVAEMAQRAHEHGALVYVDAVHFAPHGLLDVQALHADFLVCSAYKFFGPHVGVLWGRRALLEALPSYKLRPAPDRLPGKWMTGTQNHEGIAGTAAAVEYLSQLGSGNGAPEAGTLRAALDRAFERIAAHEQALLVKLIGGLQELPVRIWGITDESRFEQRVPTVSITAPGHTPQALADALGAQGLFSWPGNHYALPLTEALGLEPHGTLRFGLLHYNTSEEVDRLLAALQTLLRSNLP